MRVALFVELYQCGGIETFLVNLVNSWPAPDDTFVLVANATYPGLPAIEARLVRPVEIVRYDAISNPDLAGLGGWLNLAKRVVSPVTRYVRMAFSLPRLRALLRATHADVLMVVNGGYPGGDLCRMAGVAWRSLPGRGKSVHNFHNMAAGIPWYVRVQETLVDRLLSRVTHRFVTVSQAAAASMASRPGISRARSTSYIHNGLAVPGVQERPQGNVRSELGIDRSAPLCLMMGTYEPRKGHRFLFEAFKKILESVPDAHLVMCGFGFPYEIAQVDAHRRALGLEASVHLLGFRSDVSRLLASADVLLVGSQEYESFGLTAVEAMALRVPVVATDVGGIPEVVADGDGGYCVGHRDVEGYARRVVSLLVDGDLRRRQGELGFRRYTSRFRAEIMAGKYHALLRGLHEGAEVRGPVLPGRDISMETIAGR